MPIRQPLTPSREQRRPAVDAISGATTTSRALSEAVADALSKVKSK
ncbi:FMN-binding protein [Limosilactobacillus mucosae]|nr:FMN-binding protein [Limosilactobacillus mucosae]